MKHSILSTFTFDKNTITCVICEKIFEFPEALNISIFPPLVRLKLVKFLDCNCLPTKCGNQMGRCQVCMKPQNSKDFNKNIHHDGSDRETCRLLCAITYIEESDKLE